MGDEGAEFKATEGSRCCPWWHRVRLLTPRRSLCFEGRPCRGAGDDAPALAGLIRIAVVGAGRELPVAPVGPGRRLAALLRRLPGLRHEEGGGRGSLSH